MPRTSLSYCMTLTGSRSQFEVFQAAIAATMVPLASAIPTGAHATRASKRGGQQDPDPPDRLAAVARLTEPEACYGRSRCTTAVESCKVAPRFSARYLMRGREERFPTLIVIPASW